jgi:hypothetical protein
MTSQKLRQRLEPKEASMAKEISVSDTDHGLAQKVPIQTMWLKGLDSNQHLQ